MIFPNDEAQLLYEKGTPNDVLQRGDHWARLYLGAHGGSILHQPPDGGIDHFVYTEDDAIYDAWLAFERQIEIRCPNFSKDHAIFPVNGQWGWTRPDGESPDDTCLLSIFPQRIEAIQRMLSLYDELREWWETDGTTWRLMYPRNEDWDLQES